MVFVIMFGLNTFLSIVESMMLFLRLVRMGCCYYLLQLNYKKNTKFSRK